MAIQFQASWYHPDTRHPPHSHGELHVSILLRGGVAETVGGRSEHARPLSVVVKDPGVRHADTFGPDGTWMARISLGERGLEDVLDDRRRAVGWRWAHDPTVAAPFLRLVQRATARRVDFPDDDPDALDLLAALTARHAPASGEPPAWLQDTIHFARAQWDPALSVSALARRAGVHPVYLARCTRRWYGVGLGDELRRQRLRAAAMAVTESPGTVSAIAHDLGFSDEAHLCREFRRATGVTPGRYRRLVREMRLCAAPR